MASQDDIKAALDRLLQEITGKDMTILDASEIATIRELVDVESKHPGAIRAWAKFHTTMRGLGAIGEGAAGVVKWMIVLVSFYATIKTGLMQWIIDSLGHSK